MAKDSDPIIRRNSPDDFTSILVDSISGIPFKFLGLMFVMFVFVSSDVFINRILGNFTGAVEYKSPTSTGVVIQGMMLVVAMIVIDALIRQKIV